MASSTTIRGVCGRRAGRPGVALLIVVVLFEVLAMIVFQFMGNSIGKFALARNAADEVVAYYNARSGVNLVLLALEFQYELTAEGGIIGQAVERSNFQLYQYLDLLLPTFVSARIDSPVGSLDLNETGAIGFGDIQGDIIFHDPQPEEAKINLNAFSGNILEQEALLELCSLFAPSQYDSLFGPPEEPEDPELPTRGEVIGAIVDYVDSDSNMVTVDEGCNIQSSGLGAEDRRYDDYTYGNKNEPFTALDELLLVAGVSQEIYDTFAPNLTVYAVAQEFYVNLADAQGFMGFLCAHTAGIPSGINPCSNVQIASQIGFISLALEGWVRFFSNPFMLLDFYLGFSSGQAEARVAEGIAAGQMIAFRTEADFLTVLDLFLSSPETAAEYALLANPQLAALFGFAASGGQSFTPPVFSVTFNEGSVAQRISIDIPRVFTVTATGTYGFASRTITTVVDFTQNGKLLYWREY